MTTTQFDARAFLVEVLAGRLDPAAMEWLEAAGAEILGGVSSPRFGSLLSLASRHIPARLLELSGRERERASSGVPGWNPERWDMREAARVCLILSRADLDKPAFVADLEDAFKYADEGELRALYKSLSLLPEGGRFTWRAGEGCRTNIVPVFESVACDSPFAQAHFKEVAWKQLVVKALFIGAPLWRVYGLDQRLSEDLARMVLDLVEERSSAGRQVPCELWLALGPHGGERALALLSAEGTAGDTLGARAARLALKRREETDWVSSGCDQAAYRAFDPRETE